MKKEDIGTKYQVSWCPGCPNFMILESVKRAVANLTEQGFKKKEFAFTAGIGCHGKIYDGLNLNGVYCLHGRAIPTAVGIKVANPNMNVLVFAGDGDTYSEGMEHFIHAFKYNVNMTLIVHDNQSFSLTTGQATPTSQVGFKTGPEPFGKVDYPINPLRIALASGATFIARCNAMDIEHTAEILEKAIKHKGFSYVEIMQKCLIFNRDMNDLESLMNKVEDNEDYNQALNLINAWDYNEKTGQINLGVLYQTRYDTLIEKWEKSQGK